MPTVNLSMIDDLLRTTQRVGAPLGDELTRARAIESEVLDSLAAYSRRMSEGDEYLGAIVPSDVRESLAARLRDSIDVNESAVQGIDTAFGPGTWMAEVADQAMHFQTEAHRVLLAPNAGPTTAEHAINLLGENAWAYHQAIETLQQGNVGRMVDTSMRQVIDVADDAAFAAAADDAAATLRIFESLA